MSALDEFREASAEPVEMSLRALVQVRESSIWVGLFRLDGSPHAGGTRVWQQRYLRPPGKTTGECVAAAFTALWTAQQRGDGVP